MSEDQRRVDFEQALPWYVNGTLDAEGRRRVEAYLRDMPQAAADLQRHLDMRQTVRTRAPLVPVDMGWDEYARRVGLQQAPATGDRSLRALVSARLPSMAWARRPAFAVCAVAVMVIEAGVIFSQWTDRVQDVDGFVAHRSASSRLPLLQLRFKRDVTEFDARKLLLSVDARIVDGPSQLGDYSISVPAERIEAVRQVLAGSPLVDLVSAAPQRGCCSQ